MSLPALAGFAAGACVGSFLNVVAYRLPRGLSFVTPRSACPECGEPIRARDNVPLLSFAWLLGQCRACFHPIPWRYPGVEAVAGAFGAWLGHHHLAAGGTGDPAALLIEAIFLAWLLVVALVDLERHLIPDALTLPGVMAGLIGSALHPGSHAPFWDVGFPAGSAVLDGLLAATLAPAALWAIGWIGGRALGREAMGLGDVKLVAMLGAFLGCANVGLAFLVAVGAGAGIGTLVLVVRRNRYLPFGPFLALGAAAMALAPGGVRYVLLDAWPAFLARLIG